MVILLLFSIASCLPFKILWRLTEFPERSESVLDRTELEGKSSKEFCAKLFDMQWLSIRKELPQAVAKELSKIGAQSESALTLLPNTAPVQSIASLIVDTFKSQRPITGRTNRVAAKKAGKLYRICTVVCEDVLPDWMLLIIEIKFRRIETRFKQGRLICPARHYAQITQIRDRRRQESAFDRHTYHALFEMYKSDYRFPPGRLKSQHELGVTLYPDVVEGVKYIRARTTANQVHSVDQCVCVKDDSFKESLSPFESSATKQTNCYDASRSHRSGHSMKVDLTSQVARKRQKASSSHENDDFDVDVFLNLDRSD